MVSEPALPALPKQIDDVTSTSGEVLRGVGFVSGTYTDTTGVTPLTGAPTTEQNGVHSNFLSPVFFPQRLATVNYFGALDGNGTDGRTRLITTPAQYRSDAGSTTTNTERRFGQLGLQLYYSNNISTYDDNTPALAAPPSISGVGDTVLPGQVQISTHITGDPSAGIQKAWVTYTGETGPFHGSWQSVDLVQNPLDSTLWTATLTVPITQTVGDVRYIVQAVNGVGLVGLDNNLGDGYTPGERAGVTPPQTGAETTLTLESGAVDGVSGTSLAVSPQSTLRPGIRSRSPSAASRPRRTPTTLVEQPQRSCCRTPLGATRCRRRLPAMPPSDVRRILATSASPDPHQPDGRWRSRRGHQCNADSSNA